MQWNSKINDQKISNLIPTKSRFQRINITKKALVKQITKASLNLLNLIYIVM